MLGLTIHRRSSSSQLKSANNLQFMITKPNQQPPARLSLTILLVLIALGIVARLYRIQDPMLGYRPHDTASIARNFYQNGMHIFYPQIDWRGNSTGYVESEFRLYTYAVALLYHLFGVHEVIGRLVSVTAYALSALLLFALARRLFEDRAALLSVLFYSMATICSDGHAQRSREIRLVHGRGRSDASWRDSQTNRCA